jgi:hypothetical protein
VLKSPDGFGYGSLGKTTTRSGRHTQRKEKGCKLLVCCPIAFQLSDGRLAARQQLRKLLPEKRLLSRFSDGPKNLAERFWKRGEVNDVD